MGKQNKMGKKIRKFKTGANRDTDENKLDYEGFLSPTVLRRFAEYMHKHRIQSNGKLRTSDNWQKGIPLEVYIKSAWRHFIDWWLEHRGNKSREGIEDALCGLFFNVQGYLHEYLKMANLKKKKCDECGNKYREIFIVDGVFLCSRCKKKYLNKRKTF